MAISHPAGGKGGGSPGLRAAPLHGEGTLPLLLARKVFRGCRQPLTPVSLFPCFFPSSPAVCLTLFCPSLPPAVCVTGSSAFPPRPLSFPLSLSDFSRAISSPPLPSLSAASPTAMVSRSLYCPPWLSEPESLRLDGDPQRPLGRHLPLFGIHLKLQARPSVVEHPTPCRNQCLLDVLKA